MLLKRLAAYSASLAKSEPLIVSPALLVLSCWIALFCFVILDGYGLYFLNLHSNPWVILALTALEFTIAARWFLRQNPRIQGDPLELAGFMLVVVGVWLYFVYPSWPTLLPPTHHGDAANHAAYVDSVFSSGYLISTYPSGAALIIATFAHWIGWSDLRMVHLTASLFMALTAGSLYGLACDLFPDRREYKTIALLTVLGLFVTWGYFAGILIDFAYFLTQAIAQFFVVAFIWFLSRHLRSFHLAWVFGMAMSLIGISVSWQLWLFVPLVALGLAVFGEWRAGGVKRKEGLATVSLVLLAPAVFWAVLVITSPELFPAPAHLYNSGGAILTPSLDALGGTYLVLPVLGVLLAIRSGYRMRAAFLFLAAALLLIAGLVAWRLSLGLAVYWVDKSFYMLVLPLALFAVIPLARGVEVAQALMQRGALASMLGFGAVLAGIIAVIAIVFPPPIYSPIRESDLQTAVWAKEHLDTTHVNLIGKKSLTASWIGAGIWGEKYPRDLFVDLLALGPRTFSEWRSDPGWGEYLMTTSKQEMPADPTLKVVYQNGKSAIFQKPANSMAPAPPPTLTLGNVFGIESLTGVPDTIQSGETISFTAQLRTLGIPSTKVVWRLQFRDRDYISAADASIYPFDDRFPFQRWPIGVDLSQSFTLTLPSSIEAGRYKLQLGLYYESTGSPLPIQPPAMDSGDVAEIASFKVALPPAKSDELALITPDNATIGTDFLLLGYREDRTTPLRPGDSLALTLYWKCLAPSSQDYTVFVHLLDSSGQVQFQRDNAPRAGKYPTSLWSAGEIVPDSYTLTIPKDAAPGNYHLEVGMYEWPSLERLPVRGGNGGSSGDHVELPFDLTVRY